LKLRAPAVPGHVRGAVALSSGTNESIGFPLASSPFVQVAANVKPVRNAPVPRVEEEREAVLAGAEDELARPAAERGVEEHRLGIGIEVVDVVRRLLEGQLWRDYMGERGQGRDRSPYTG
jgi:hypothetical protein